MKLNKEDFDQLAVDYGTRMDEHGGWRRFARGARPRGPIKNAGHYVAACRRLLYVAGWTREDVLAIDGRLVGCGFNHISPSE